MPLGPVKKAIMGKKPKCDTPKGEKGMKVKTPKSTTPPMKVKKSK